MTCKKALALAALLAVINHPLRAAESCSFGVAPETSGFKLNPILNKLVVTKVSTPSDTCSLRVNDEILQLNQQAIPGKRALAVMKYWKSLPKDAPATFKVKRGNSVLTLIVK